MKSDRTRERDAIADPVLHYLQGSAIPSRELWLRFFDLDVLIRSDSLPHIDLFERMYSRFRTNSHPSPAPFRLDITLLARPENPWQAPILLVDQELWPLREPRLLEGWVYAFILSNIIARIRSHYLVHAGVVAWGDQGFILPAESGHGKTTLVLELVRRGFRFLSDEMAALGRADRRVHPFPRTLRVKPDALTRIGTGERAADTPVWLDKLLLDIDEIFPGSMAAPAPIAQIIFLQVPAQEGRPFAADAGRELRISVDRVDDDLLRAIARVEGVEHAGLTWVEDCRQVRVVTARRMAALVEIEKLCRQRRTLILDVNANPRSRPAFEGPATLEPLPKGQAVSGLLGLFRGGLAASLLREELDFSAARLYWEMAGMVTGANCYRLTVGPLEQMADLICGLLPTCD